MKKELLTTFLAGMLPFSNAVAVISDKPDILEVSIGGLFGPAFQAQLQKDTILYTSRKPDNSTPRTVTLPIPNARWVIFKNKIDALNIWKWPKFCENVDVLDGTQWKVEIHYANQSIESSGSNSFPMAAGICNHSPNASEDFNKFLHAMRELTGKDFH